MGNTVKKIGDETFENEIAKGLVLVDFYADWCGPCKMLSPIIEEVAGQLSFKASFIKVDVDKAQANASKYGVTSIPTLILFKDGKEVERVVGLQDEEALKHLIEKHS